MTELESCEAFREDENLLAYGVAVQFASVVQLTKSFSADAKGFGGVGDGKNFFDVHS